MTSSSIYKSGVFGKVARADTIAEEFPLVFCFKPCKEPTKHVEDGGLIRRDQILGLWPAWKDWDLLDLWIITNFFWVEAGFILGLDLNRLEIVIKYVCNVHQLSAVISFFSPSFPSQELESGGVD